MDRTLHELQTPDTSPASHILGSQGLVEGLEDGNLRLTDKGHLTAEDIPARSHAGGSLPAAKFVNKQFDCFVSYAGEDRDTVRQLVDNLVKRDVRVWWKS